MGALKYIVLLLSNVLLATCVDWTATFDPVAISVLTSSTTRVHLTLSDLSDEAIANINDISYIQLKSENERFTKTDYSDKF